MFTDRQQVYKARAADFDDAKASSLGTYMPTALEMDDGERVLTVLDPGKYTGQLLLFFENGKCARFGLDAYETKTNRKKLVNAYSDKSPLASVIVIDQETDMAVFSDDGRAMVFNTSLMQPKTSRSTQGVNCMTVKNRHKLTKAMPLSATAIKNVSRYRMRSIPAAGALVKDEDRGEEQLSLMD